MKNINAIDKAAVAGAITYQSVKNALQGENLSSLLAVYAAFKRFDTQLSSELAKRKLKVSALPIVITSEDKTQAEYLTLLTKKNSFKIMLFDAMNALENAFSVFMVEWVKENEYIFPKLKHLNSRYFNYDPKTGELFYTKSGQKTYVNKNKNLFTYYHPTDSGDLVEQSIMHKVVCILALKQTVMSKNMLYFDALSVPPTIIKSDKIGDEEVANKIIDNALMLRSAGVALFDKEDVVELLKGNTDKGTFLDFIRYCDECISKVITGQVLAGNSVQNGTEALGSIHNEIRKDVLLYDAMLLDSGITPLLKKALELNFANVAKFDFSFDTKDQDEDYKKADEFKSIKDLGFNLPKETIEDTFNIKGLEKNAFIQNVPKLPLDNIDKALQTAEFKSSLNKSETDIKTIVGKVINSSSSYEEALDKLYEDYEDMDLFSLEDELSLAIANATIKGKANGY